MKHLLVALVLPLAGCAFISGPCSVDAGARAAVCEPGGTMLLIPATILRAVASMDP